MVTPVPFTLILFVYFSANFPRSCLLSLSLFLWVSFSAKGMQPLSASAVTWCEKRKRNKYAVYVSFFTQRTSSEMWSDSETWFLSSAVTVLCSGFVWARLWKCHPRLRCGRLCVAQASWMCKYTASELRNTNTIWSGSLLITRQWS